jgi:hypothetical protein
MFIFDLLQDDFEKRKNSAPLATTPEEDLLATVHLHRVEGLNGGQHRMRVTLAGDSFQSPVGLAPPILHDAELCRWNFGE